MIRRSGRSRGCGAPSRSVTSAWARSVRCGASACYDGSADVFSDRLHHDYFGLGPLAQPGGASTYQLTYGGWIRVLRGAGLIIEDLIEPQPAPGQPSGYYDFRPSGWATRWPCEALWIARKP
jgi:hypothetical protein